MELLNEELMHLSKVVAASSETVHMNFDKFLLLIVSVHSALSNSYCNLYQLLIVIILGISVGIPCLLRYCRLKYDCVIKLKFIMKPVGFIAKSTIIVIMIFSHSLHAMVRGKGTCILLNTCPHMYTHMPLAIDTS